MGTLTRSAHFLACIGADKRTERLEWTLVAVVCDWEQCLLRER